MEHRVGLTILLGAAVLAAVSAAMLAAPEPATDVEREAERMLEALDGRARGARLTSLVNDSQQNRGTEPAAVRAMITPDLKRPRFRIETTAPGLRLVRVVDGERHWRLTRAGHVEPVPDDGGPPITAEKIFQALNLRKGSTACEIGAGDGALSIAAARVVGPTGRVYASELGDNRVRRLRDKVAGSRLEQITVVAGDPVRTNFPEAGCDAAFMRDVYHHFSDPAAMNASILTALKPGGRLVIVDFTPPPGREATQATGRSKDGMHGISLESVSRETREAGFDLMASEAGTRWFMVVVSKPK